MSNASLISERSLTSKLTRKILTWTMLIFFFAMVAIALLTTYSNKQEVMRNGSNSLQNTILDIEKVLVDVESATESMAWIVTGEPLDDEDLSRITTEMVRADTSIIAAAIAYEPFKSIKTEDHYHMVTSYVPEGTDEIKATLLGSEDYDYHILDWYQIPKLLRKSYWSEPTFDNATSQMVTSYSKPLFNAEGEFIGIIKSDVALTWLTEKISSLKPYSSAYTLLIGRNGSYIAHKDKESILNETIFSFALSTGDPKRLEDSKEIMSGKNGVLHFKADKGYSYGFYGPLKNGWTAVMICAQKDLFRSARIINITLFIIALLGLISLYLTSRKAISRSLMPITEFTYAAASMAKGNFDAHIPEVNSKDEIRNLHDSLLYLQKSITKYIKELRATLLSNQKFESELNIASSIQRNMLPIEFPVNDKFDLFAFLEPAKEVGGDLYDFYVKDGYLYFAIGDVSGKGVPAALFMAITRSAYRFISGMGVPMAQVESNINNAFSEGNESGMFVTMFIGRINLETYHMEYCNAGHNPIVIIRPDGTTSFLKAKPNLAAGLFDSFEYQGEELQLEKGCRLLLYTDGISEAENKQKELFGDDRLLAFASSADRSMSSREFSEGLLGKVREFTAGNAQNDDITIMSIKL